MDRGAWWATVHGVTRVRHDLVTRPPPPTLNCAKLEHFLDLFKKIYVNTFQTKKPHPALGNIKHYNNKTYLKLSKESDMTECLN